MPVIVDPEIRILPDNHKIFVLHPGSGKRFYADFRDSESVFLDLPGVKFDAAPTTDTPELRNLLRMSRAIANWRRNGEKGEPPSRDPSKHTVANPAVQTPKLAHAIFDLYHEAKPGDLVIIPGKGYNSTVYIGEFVGEFDPEHRVSSIRYPAELIPARKVRWLPAALAKGQFNRRLIRLMQNRQAIIQINGDAEHREIYNIAYGDYIWKESSGSLIRVTEEEIDLNDLNKAVDLTNYFAAQYLALKKGELSKFLELDFHNAIEAYYDKNYFGGVSVEIHSPGYFNRRMKDALLAGYVSAMLALSASGVTPQEAKDAQVVNSANIEASICDMELETDIRQTMEMYANIHLWEEVICPKRELTKVTVGLKTDVTIKKTAKNPD
ncbi:hypothetical protein [Agrobacterium tumefaciens]|uniref:hypothetical protein n=1 Tax=Agrobacterium tumefaciens TaxID=358 RepID=UPI001AEA4857|nr:hypothetical protein [Agrobacterium tumefaciens]MBP2534095.1 hypothetical protein [Agrobacterium tumefaciens]